jgi:hypothetical protein
MRYVIRNLGVGELPVGEEVEVASCIMVQLRHLDQWGTAQQKGVDAVLTRLNEYCEEVAQAHPSADWIEIGVRTDPHAFVAQSPGRDFYADEDILRWETHEDQDGILYDTPVIREGAKPAGRQPAEMGLQWSAMLSVAPRYSKDWKAGTLRLCSGEPFRRVKVQPDELDPSRPHIYAAQISDAIQY